MNTQIVLDNENNIRFLKAGFVGSMVDSTTYRLMEPIGPGERLDLPPGLVLWADKGYPSTQVLLTPLRQVQSGVWQQLTNAVPVNLIGDLANIAFLSNT